MAASIPGCQRQASAHLERAEGAGEAPRPEPTGDQAAEAGAQTEGEGPCRGSSTAHGRKKEPGLLGRGRGRLTSPVDRQKALQIIDEGIADGARALELALLLGVGLTTLQRWHRQFAGGADGVDRRKGSHRHVAHRFSQEERQRILLTCNEHEFAAMPPGQIVPVLADRGLYVGSERSCYKVLHAHGRAHRRGPARPPQEPRPVPRFRATGPKQVWS